MIRRVCRTILPVLAEVGGLTGGAALLGAADVSGPLVSLLDADTIEVLHNKRPQRLRLHSIDYPEKRQPYGKRAKARRVSSRFRKASRSELVQDGWCWWYRKYVLGKV